MNVVIDTCILIWMAVEPHRLSQKARDVLNTNDNQICISDISIFEISLKWDRSKLELPEPPRYWIPKQVRYWQLHELPLTTDMIYRSAELPKYHADPFDRLLIACAIERGFTIVSPDAFIHKYPVSVTW